ncbi:hypothetical protein [Limnoglobus roseus]|uniref:Uncharacterized protein n=1 Tax=Limnoglobus roseus TaxID=2598579 RepID=A0A5C1A577_9BACT|nr:hypothetical protein [Limnoglobus roseus]QEL14271.1 hypothetical protein PX52LOC_01142 [Limnoglobus roseus]
MRGYDPPTATPTEPTPRLRGWERPTPTASAPRLRTWERPGWSPAYLAARAAQTPTMTPTPTLPLEPKAMPPTTTTTPRRRLRYRDL